MNVATKKKADGAPSASHAAVERQGGEAVDASNNVVDHEQRTREAELNHTQLINAYLDHGFALVPLPSGSKSPSGKAALDWNKPQKLVRDAKTARQRIRAGQNVGVHLKSSGMASFDPDDMERTRLALTAVGLDVDDILAAGWNIYSGRPNRRRCQFKAAPGLSSSKLVLPYREKNAVGRDVIKGETIFELRGYADNEQDVLPPSIHPDTQRPYSADPLPETLPPMPPGLVRLYKEFDALRPKMLAALGCDQKLLGAGTGQKLAFDHDFSGRFNRANSVEQILERNDYAIRRTSHGIRARHPDSTSGSFSARLIPGTSDLWQSDNGNDPLYGLFDAWSAFVVLEHGGDVDAAAQAFNAPVAKAAEPPPPPPPPATVYDPSADLPDSFTIDWLVDPANRLPLPVYRVDELLPPGVYILAGPPKGGKSVFAMQLGLCIAAGIPFLGKKTEPCEVLYLDMESPHNMLQERMRPMHRKLVQGAKLAKKFIYDLGWKETGAEFVEKLEGLIAAMPDLRFVVVDVFQRIRPPAGYTSNAYGLDYETLAPFSDLRKRHPDLCILLLHHTRKMPSDDPFEMLSGTQGLFGAIDGAFMFLRPQQLGGKQLDAEQKEATKNLIEFHGKHRWNAGIEFVIERHSLTDHSFYYELSAVKPWDIVASLEHKRLLELMSQHPEKTWTAKELADELGKSPKTVQNQLYLMKRREMVVAIPGVGYKVPPTRTRKY